VEWWREEKERKRKRGNTCCLSNTPDMERHKLWLHLCTSGGKKEKKVKGVGWKGG